AVDAFDFKLFPDRSEPQRKCRTPDAPTCVRLRLASGWGMADGGDRARAAIRQVCQQRLEGRLSVSAVPDHGRSTTTATPCPTPTHRVARRRLRWRCWSS